MKQDRSVSTRFPLLQTDVENGPDEGNQVWRRTYGPVLGRKARVPLNLFSGR
jgi:hypothetical protein